MSHASPFKPKKRLGQHFLIDKNALSFIIRQAKITPRDVILEIGPGRGFLTRELAKRAKAVYAVEIDAELVSFLNKEFKETPNLKVFCADAFKADFYYLFQGLPFPQKLVSNLPYHLASTLILRLLENYSELKSYLIMVQKEVAQRMVALKGTKDYGAYTLKVSYFSHLEILRVFPKEIFRPPPRVDSALVSLKRKAILPGVDYRCFKILVEAAFSHRRKKMANNLAKKFGLPLEVAREVLEGVSLGPEIRAENLSLTDYLSLVRIFQAKGYL